MNNTSEIDFASGNGDEMGDICPLRLETANLLEVCLKSAAIILVFFISLIGNCLVIKVIYRDRRLRKASHCLIVNMAAADLLITLTNMPEAAKTEITRTNRWFSGSFGLAICKLLPFCQNVSISCSIFTLVAISLDKYVTIVYPFKRIMTTKRLRLVILLIWLASAVTASPQLIANSLVHDEDGSIWCFEEWPSPFDPVLAPKHYTIVSLLILYILPLSLITVLYSRVFFAIWRRRVPGNCTAATIRSQQRSRQKAGKMFIAVIVCFALCWLTAHISFFLSYFDPEYSICGPPDVVWFLGSFFGFANSALNPCIYFLLDKKYRKGLKEILCCQGNRRSISDVSRTVRTRQVYSYTQDISGRAVSMELLEFADPYRVRSAQRGQDAINLVHFRTLPQEN